MEGGREGRREGGMEGGREGGSVLHTLSWPWMLPLKKEQKPTAKRLDMLCTTDGVALGDPDPGLGPALCFLGRTLCGACLCCGMGGMPRGRSSSCEQRDHPVLSYGKRLPQCVRTRNITNIFSKTQTNAYTSKCHSPH